MLRRKNVVSQKYDLKHKAVQLKQRAYKIKQINYFPFIEIAQKAVFDISIFHMRLGD